MTERHDLERSVHLNFAGFFRDSIGFSDTGVVHEEHGIMLWAAATDFPVMANGVIRLDDSAPAAEVHDVATEIFASRGRGYTWFARDLPQDADLEQYAQQREWGRLIDMPEMVCLGRVDDPAPTVGVELRPVVDAPGVRDYAAVSAEAYATIGMPAEEVPAWFSRPAGVLEPHLCAVLAYLDDQPVSAAMANLSHGIGGVYWVGTVPAARGRALADACTRVVTNWAFDAGASAVSLQASHQGEPIYRAMGYADMHRYFGYVVPGPA